MGYILGYGIGRGEGAYGRYMDGWLHAPYPIPPPPSGMQPTGPPLPGGTITYMVLDEFIPLWWGLWYRVWWV